jgi:phosphatidylinositol N-acetylglucosaminyltransferase subunit P
MSGNQREYYGFVLYLVSFLSLILYILWSFFDLFPVAPNQILAITVPIWIVGLIPFLIILYSGVNLIKTPPFDSINLYVDQYTNELQFSDRLLDQNRIPPLQDVPLDIVNQCWTR